MLMICSHVNEIMCEFLFEVKKTFHRKKDYLEQGVFEAAFYHIHDRKKIVKI